jgi:hypothetical protein
VEFYKGVRKGSRITLVVCFFGFYLTLTYSLIYRCIGFSTFSTTVACKNDKYVKYNVISYINYGIYDGPSKKQISDMVKARRETFNNSILCPTIYRCECVSGWYYLIEINSNDIDIIPPIYVTPKKCEHAFNYCNSNIKYIPKNCMSLKMCQTAFDINIEYFKYFSKIYITQKMCDVIVKIYPHYILKEIPVRFITTALCSHIVKDNNTKLCDYQTII